MGIHLPATRSLPRALFLAVWLGFWSMGEWFAITQIVRGGFGVTDVFLAFWLVIWTIAGAGVAGVLLWQFIGRERLFVTAGSVIQERGFSFLKSSRTWMPGEATGFRRVPASMTGRDGVSGRGIVFDAGGRPRYFGAGMTAAESGSVLAAIARHLPEAGAQS